MTSVMFAKLPSILLSASRPSQTPQFIFRRLLNVSSVDLAARKGTREKAKKKKVKVEIKKVEYIPHNLRNLKNVVTKVEKPIEDSWKQKAIDDVWPYRYFQWKVYSATEAIDCFKESHHPTMYNLPDAFLDIRIELDMCSTKRTKFLDNFSHMCMIPHGFEREGKKSILIFCKEEEMHNPLMDAGAALVGGVDLVKRVQSGNVNLIDYDYIITNPNFLMDLVPIRGLLKRKFPTVKNGTIDNDLFKSLKKHLDGIQYRATKHAVDSSFGLVEIPIGRLNMDTNKLEENIIAVIKDVDSMRPKRDGLFIQRVFLKSSPLSQLYKIDPFVYIATGIKEGSSTVAGDESDSDSDDEEKKMLSKITS